MSNIIKSKMELSPLFKLRNLILDNQTAQEKLFLGRILTIIDASISDREQRKGLKDLIKDAFYHNGWKDDVRRILYDFADKFAPDALPNEQEENEFFGRMPITDSSGKQTFYFNEYN